MRRPRSDIARSLPRPCRALREVLARPIAHAGVFIASQALVGWVLLPLAAAVSALLLRRSGSRVLANEAILTFLLSPAGIAVLILSLVTLLVGVQLGRGGAILLASGRAREGWSATAQLIAAGGRILALAFRQIAQGTLLAAPFLLAIGVIAWLVLRDRDPYYIIMLRPQRFWIGLGSALPIALAGAFLLLRHSQRQLLALPLLLIDERTPAQSIRESRELMRQAKGASLGRGRWLLIIGVVALGALAAALVHGATLWILPWFGEGRAAVAVMAVYLLLESAIVAATSFLAITSDGVLGVLGLRPAGIPPRRTGRPMSRVTLGIILSLGIAIALLVSAKSLVVGGRPFKVLVIAHRGASTAAPENTLAAVRAAIDAGADGVEIDIRLSADGKLIAVHDVDFRRVARDPRRVRDLTFEEMRAFDVGAWFSPEFAGERAPSLEEILEVLRPTELLLNIELKADGDEDALAERVVMTVRDAGMSDRVVLTTLDTSTFEALARHGPELRRGAILSALVGNPNRIEADLLAVRAGLLADLLSRAQRERSLGIHAWTVSPGAQATRMALLGADGVLTSDPAGVRATFDELEAMTETERLLLALRERLMR